MSFMVFLVTDFVMLLLLLTAFSVLTTFFNFIFGRRRRLLAHADAVAFFLRLEVVVVSAASGVREASAAARSRIEVPTRDHLETVASDRVQRTGGFGLDGCEVYRKQIWNIH